MPNELTELFRENNPESTFSDEDITLRFAEENKDRLDVFLEKYPRFREDYNSIISGAFPVTFGDRAKQFVASGVRGVAGTLASLPEAIGIGAAEIERRTGLGEATWGAPTDPKETLSGTVAEGIKGVGEWLAPDVPIGKRERMGEDFLTTTVPGAVGSAVGFLAGGGVASKAVGGMTKAGAQKIGKEIFDETLGKEFVRLSAKAPAGVGSKVVAKKAAERATEALKKYQKRLGKLTTTGTIGTLGAAAGGSEGYRDAIASGADRDTAFNSFLLNGLVGTTEVVPIGNMLNRLDDMSGGTLKEAIALAGKEALEEAVQEGIQGTAGDTIAKYILEYDPDREMFHRLADEAGAGAIAGSLLSLIASGINRKLRNLQTTEEPDRPLTNVELTNKAYDIGSDRVVEIRKKARVGDADTQFEDPAEKGIFDAEINRLKGVKEQEEVNKKKEADLKDITRDKISPTNLLSLAQNLRESARTAQDGGTVGEQYEKLDRILNSKRLNKRVGQAMDGEVELEEKELQALVHIFDELGFPVEVGERGDLPAWAMFEEEANGLDDWKVVPSLEKTVDEGILQEEGRVQVEEQREVKQGEGDIVPEEATAQEIKRQEAQRAATQQDLLSKEERDDTAREQAGLMSKYEADVAEEERATDAAATEWLIQEEQLANKRQELANKRSQETTDEQSVLKPINEQVGDADAQIEALKNKVIKPGGEDAAIAELQAANKNREDALEAKARYEKNGGKVTSEDIAIDTTEITEGKENQAVAGGGLRPVFFEANDGSSSGTELEKLEGLSDEEVSGLLMPQGTNVKSGHTQRVVFVESADGSTVEMLGLVNKNGVTHVTLPKTQIDEKGRVVSGKGKPSTVPIKEFLNETKGKVVSNARLKFPRKYPSQSLTPTEYTELRDEILRDFITAKERAEGVDVDPMQSSVSIEGSQKQIGTVDPEVQDSSGEVFEGTAPVTVADTTPAASVENEETTQAEVLLQRLMGVVSKAVSGLHQASGPKVAKSGSYFYPRTADGEADTTQPAVHAVKVNGETRYVTSMFVEGGLGKIWYEFKDSFTFPNPNSVKGTDIPYYSSKKDIVESLQGATASTTDTGLDPVEVYDEALFAIENWTKENPNSWKTIKDIYIAHLSAELKQRQEADPNFVLDLNNAPKDLDENVIKRIGQSVQQSYENANGDQAKFAAALSLPSGLAGPGGNLLIPERLAAPSRPRPSHPRASAEEIHEAHSAVVEALLAAGVNVEIVNGEIADLENRVTAYFQVDPATGERLVRLAMQSVTNPTTSNLTDAMHEVGHVVSDLLNESTRAQIFNSISKVRDEALGIQNTKFVYYNSDNVPDSLKQEERLVETVARQLVRSGFNPAQATTWSQNLIRGLRHLLLAAKVAIQKAIKGKTHLSDKAATEYFRLQVEAFLTGRKVPSYLDYIFGFKPTIADKVRTSDKVQEGDLINYYYDPKNNTISHPRLVPDTLERALHNADNTIPKSVDVIVKYRPKPDEYSDEELAMQRESARHDVAVNSRFRDILSDMFSAYLFSGLNKINPDTGAPALLESEFKRILQGSGQDPQVIIDGITEYLGDAAVADTKIEDLNEEDTRKRASLVAAKMVRKAIKRLSDKYQTAQENLPVDGGGLSTQVNDMALEFEQLVENYRNLSFVQELVGKVLRRTIRTYKRGRGIMVQKIFKEILHGKTKKEIDKLIEENKKIFKTRQFIDALDGLAKSGIDIENLTNLEIQDAVNSSTNASFALLKNPVLLAYAVSFARQRPEAMLLLEVRGEEFSGGIDQVITAARNGTADSAAKKMDTVFNENPKLRFKEGKHARLTRLVHSLVKKIQIRKKQLANKRQELAEYKAILEVSEIVTPLLEKELAQLQAVNESELAFGNTQFELTNNSEIMVPIGPMASVSSVSRNKKTISLTKNRDVKWIAEIKKMRDAQAEWLMNVPENERGAVWQTVNRQKNAIDKVIADQMQRAIEDSFVIRFLGSFTDQLELVGSPMAQKISTQVRNYSAMLQSHGGNKAKVLGFNWANALQNARIAMGYDNISDFKDDYYDSAMQFFYRRRDVLLNRGEDALIEEFKKELLRNAKTDVQAQNITAAWPKLRVFYKLTAKNSAFVDKMRRDMGLKVYDEVSGEFRESIGSSISTTMRKPSEEAQHVYDHIKDRWETTDIGANTFSEILALIQSDAEGFDTYIKKRYGTAGAQDTMFQMWVKPLLEQAGESLMPVVEGNEVVTNAPRNLVQQALRENPNDIVAFARSLYMKMEVDKTELGELAEGERGLTEAEIEEQAQVYTAHVLATMEGLWKRFAATHLPTESNKGIAIATAPHVMMDARQFNEWPDEWVSYASFGERDMYQFAKHLSVNAAFGRDLTLLTNDLEVAIAEQLGFKNHKKTIEKALRLEGLEPGILSLPSKKRAYEKEYKKKAEAEGLMYEAVLNAHKNHKTLIRLRKNFNAWMEKERGTPMEFGVWNDLIRTMTGHIVQSPGTALTDTIAIVEQPFKKLGFSTTAFKFVGSNVKGAFGVGASSFMQIFTNRVNFAHDDMALMKELGLSDPAAMEEQEGGWWQRIVGQFRANMADEFVSTSKIGKGAERLSRILKVPLEVGIGKGLYPSVRPQAIFTQLSLTAATANTLSTWKTYRNLVVQVADYMENNPEFMRTYQENGLVFNEQILGENKLKKVIEDLGYGKKFGLFNDARAFAGLTEALHRNGLTIEGMAMDYISRRQSNPKAQPIADHATYVTLAHLTQSEVMLETDLTTRTPELLTSGTGYFVSPLLGWSVQKFVDVNKSLRDEQLKAGGKFMGIGLPTREGMKAYLAVFPIALAYAYLRDEYDEEIVGKKTNVQRGQGLLGAPSLAEVQEDPYNALQIIFERLDRVGTFGFGGELASQTVNYESTREFSVDNRVYAINTMRTLIQTMSKFAMQGGIDGATYQTIGRPLAQSLGGSGYIQWWDIFNNALDKQGAGDNIESRIARRIGVQNYLRSVGKTMNLEVRTYGGGAALPNRIKPHVGNMVVSAMANDMGAFEDAYKRAYHAAIKEGKEDPAKTVKLSFGAYHPLKIVYKSPPTQQEYEDLLKQLNPDGSKSVSEAINMFNEYGKKLEIEPYYGKRPQKKGMSRLIRMPSMKPPSPSFFKREEAMKAAFDIATP